MAILLGDRSYSHFEEEWEKPWRCRKFGHKWGKPSGIWSWPTNPPQARQIQTCRRRACGTTRKTTMIVYN